MFKKIKIFLFLILGFSFLVLPNFTQAIEKPVDLYFFYSKTCPHCKKEALFLTKLQKEYGNKLKIYNFEIIDYPENIELLRKFGAIYSLDTSRLATPVTFIGDQYISGFYNEEYTGTQIKNLIDQTLSLGTKDLGAQILNSNSKLANKTEEVAINKNQNNPNNFNVPILGNVDLEQLSLFGFLSAWLNTFLFIGYLLIVRIIVAILAVSFGIYGIRKFLHDKKATCEVSHTESRQKILQKIKKIALSEKILPALVGIVLLAFSVNIIELACSAGFPAIYTKALALHNLSSFGYYAYLSLYIFFFMLDDIIVFTIAMFTLRLTGIDAKYSRYSNLIGGIVILILGLLLLFKPEWLMFA
jgi:thiol-disulfide isomerase/thioredoxin